MVLQYRKLVKRVFNVSASLIHDTLQTLIMLEQRVHRTITAHHCLSNAMHGHWTEYKFTCLCVSVCPSHFLSTRLQVRPLNGFLQLIA